MIKSEFVIQKEKESVGDKRKAASQTPTSSTSSTSSLGLSVSPALI